MPVRTSHASTAVIGLTVLLADGPRLWVGATATARGIYTGQLWGAYDLPQYVEAIRAGAAGHLLYEGRVWGVSGGPGYLFQVPYLAAGLVGGPLHAGPFVVLEVLRWIAQAAAIGALVLLVRAVVPVHLRPWALLFSMLAGGLGWLFLSRPPTPLGPVLPMDVATPSFNLLNAFQGAPHLALVAGATSLFAWGFLAVAAGRRRGFLALLGWALALTVHPFELAPLLVATVATAVLAARSPATLLYAAAAVVLAGAEGAYLAVLVLQHSPFLSVQAGASSTTEIGNLPSLLVSRAIVLPLAAAGLLSLRYRREPALLLLGTWALLSALLNVLPLDAAGPYHRTLEGSSAAFGCLAALGLEVIAGRWRLAILGVALVSPLVEGAALVVAGPAMSDPWVPAAVVSLAERANAEDVRGAVLGDESSVHWLAAFSGLREGLIEEDVGATRQAIAQVEAGGSPSASGADFLLVTTGSPPPGEPVLQVPGAALYR